MSNWGSHPKKLEAPEETMKIRFLLALVGLAISFALPSFAQQKDTADPQLRQRYLALVKKYDDALNKNDAAAVAALFTEDAVFVTDRGPVKGRPAIERYHADLFKQLHLSNSLITVDEDSPHIIGTAGNELWATGAWSATMQGKDWGPKEIKTYWSVVREGDDWNIRMLTSVPAATPSPATTPSSQ
jgi:uncharacterized protein (TIGR02246 family)